MVDIDTIVVMNHHLREKEGLALQKLWLKQAEPFGIDVKISFDDGTLGVWRNYKQAMSIPPREPERFRLIVHDDIMVARKALEKILHVLHYAPMGFVSFYNPSNKGYINALDKGRHVMMTHTNFWPQALCLPSKLIKMLIEYCDSAVDEDYRWEDSRVKVFCDTYDVPIFCVTPGLVQHLGAFRSTLGIGGRVGKLIRWSRLFEPEFDVFGVDWVDHFNNPHRHEASVNLNEITTKREMVHTHEELSQAFAE